MGKRWPSSTHKPSLTTYAIEQASQRSQLWMVWPVSWVKDGQNPCDFLGVREEDLGHKALFPPHLPNMSDRKWLSWLKELNSAVILQDCRIITLTSSELFGFADTSVKDRRGFSVSHSPWMLPGAFVQVTLQHSHKRVLLHNPWLNHYGKRLLAVIPPAMGHLCRDIKWNFWFSPPLGQKRLLSIVLCWPGASNSSFQNNKWIPTDFHARSTWRNKSSQLATLPCLCLAYQFTS